MRLVAHKMLPLRCAPPACLRPPLASRLLHVGTHAHLITLLVHLNCPTQGLASQLGGQQLSAAQVAGALLGQRCWVKWPYLQEAVVEAVSDAGEGIGGNGWGWEGWGVACRCRA